MSLSETLFPSLNIDKTHGILFILNAKISYQI